MSTPSKVLFFLMEARREQSTPKLNFPSSSSKYLHCQQVKLKELHLLNHKHLFSINFQIWRKWQMRIICPFRVTIATVFKKLSYLPVHCNRNLSHLWVRHSATEMIYFYLIRIMYTWIVINTRTACYPYKHVCQ